MASLLHYLVTFCYLFPVLVTVHAQINKVLYRIGDSGIFDEGFFNVNEPLSGLCIGRNDSDANLPFPDDYSVGFYYASTSECLYAKDASSSISAFPTATETLKNGQLSFNITAPELRFHRLACDVIGADTNSISGCRYASMYNITITLDKDELICNLKFAHQDFDEFPTPANVTWYRGGVRLPGEEQVIAEPDFTTVSSFTDYSVKSFSSVLKLCKYYFTYCKVFLEWKTLTNSFIKKN